VKQALIDSLYTAPFIVIGLLITLKIVHHFSMGPVIDEIIIIVAGGTIGHASSSWMSRRRARLGQDGNSSATTPVNAQFLFYFFLDTPTCDGLVGDLEERYSIIQGKFGTRRANLWYWKEVIRTVGPIVSSWFMKLVMRPAVAITAWAVAHGLLKDGWFKELLTELLARRKS